MSMWLQGSNGLFECQTFARQKLPKSRQRALNQAAQSLAAFKDGEIWNASKPDRYGQKPRF
jgi:hypothetical protein